MPIAPVAKGLIFSLSILIAAGIAVYDNPHVREWINESRRKIALTLNGLDDDFQRPHSSQSVPLDDVSTREDASPEAVQRRRQAREEILRRGRVMEERRRGGTSLAKEKASANFDQLVNSDGSLREKNKVVDLEAMAAAITTSAEKVPDKGLRRRTKEAVGVNMGSVAANPFTDEVGMGFEDGSRLPEHGQWPLPDGERSATIQGESPLAVDMSIGRKNTGPDEASSTHDSELLVELTPTTSHAPSVSGTLPSASEVLTPTSTNHPTSPSPELEARQIHEPTSFQFIQEWASTTSTGPASFYSPPESEQRFRDLDTASEVGSQATSTAISVIGTDEVLNEAIVDMDAISSGEEVGTPSSWSEIGSVVSED